MAETINMPILAIQVRRGDDLTLYLDSFSYDITGFTFDGTIYPENSGTSAGTVIFSTPAASSVTAAVSAAQTDAMTEDCYYFFVRHTDHAVKKKTILKVVMEML